MNKKTIKFDDTETEKKGKFHQYRISIFINDIYILM